jgi:hypothetical protein
MSGAKYTGWRKSTYSNVNTSQCIEVAEAGMVLVRGTASRDGGTLGFTRGACTNGGQRVEARTAGAGVVVRDTVNRAGGTLTFPAGAWRALLDEVRAS